MNNPIPGPRSAIKTAFAATTRALGDLLLAAAAPPQPVRAPAGRDESQRHGLLGLVETALKLNMLSLRSPSLLLRLSVMVDRVWNGTESYERRDSRQSCG